MEAAVAVVGTVETTSAPRSRDLKPRMSPPAVQGTTTRKFSRQRAFDGVPRAAVSALELQ